MTTTWEEQLALERSPAIDEAPMPGEQGSVEWLYTRVGKVTASRFADVMNFRKDGKESAKRYDYRMELVVERLTGQPSEHYVSEYMEWGSEQEKAARMAYEAHTGNLVVVPGFIDHPAIPMCGGSPDGFVDDDGMIELKAPTSATHIETVLFEEYDHRPQMQGNLACNPKRKWCDFVSYDPRLPKHLRLYVQRFTRDGGYIAKLESGIVLFQSELDTLMTRLQQTAPQERPETARPGASSSTPPSSPAAAATFADEAHVLRQIDTAKDKDAAAEILDRVRDAPFFKRVSEAFTNRWSA